MTLGIRDQAVDLPDASEVGLCLCPLLADLWWSRTPGGSGAKV